ncbi:MAG: DUF2834 domain-containing protein [bacterium]|nr:DUF2834 domain-containing protein [bacterium]
MTLKLLGIGLVLADFLALTGYAVYHHGYLAFFDFQAMNAIQLQIFVDLAIALGFVTVWMWNDSRARGIAVMPYLVATLLLGSIGPLLYLLRREARATVPATVAPRVARA